jgi:hypothetical protein
MICESISALDFNNEMNIQDVVVFDVRAPEEHEQF